MNGDDQLKLIYGLMAVAEDQQKTVQVALADLAREVEALRAEREALRDAARMVQAAARDGVAQGVAQGVAAVDLGRVAEAAVAPASARLLRAAKTLDQSMAAAQSLIKQLRAAVVVATWAAVGLAVGMVALVVVALW